MRGDIELRHGSPARKERYNEAESWAIVGGLTPSKSAKKVETKKDTTKVTYGPDSSFSAIITHDPLSIEFQRNGETHVILNDRGFLNVEHWRPQNEKHADNESKDKDGKVETTGTGGLPKIEESTWWDEYFGGHTDSKPRGPESVALDISFPGYSHVYGIPEHADTLSLKPTRGGGEGRHSDPYRLYNSDVFEYELYSPMTLYGSIPFMQAHKKDSTVGVFWLNTAETWIDIEKKTSAANRKALGVSDQSTTETHWMSESGILDVFVFLGPSPRDLTEKYGELTGYSQLPQHFALGYHQCRWNYVSDDDVTSVDRNFDLHQIPYDTIWLDVDYTDDKKYFTWEPLAFRNPVGMQQQLDETGRKLVILIDPHIKNQNEYSINKELKSKGLAVKDKSANIFDGHCWPGSSNWVDTLNPAAKEWWTKLHKYDNFPGFMHNCFLWNDMNEPSVFSGPEATSPRDNIHFGNWEHRDIHNVYGLTFINASYDAMLERKKGEIRRPFILSRSYFAGSQRLGAVWTGDNQADWNHLRVSLPMVLNNGIAGFPFTGADVAGFFGNPSPELLTRWYQAGIWYPFFRAHAHIEYRRREPYLASEPYRSIISQSLRLRYQLLPAWYTAFHEASVKGSPIVRPQYYVHPSEEAGFALDDQFYLGSTGILVKPVTTEGAKSVDVHLADDENYYDYSDYTIYSGKGRSHKVDTPLEKSPVLVQGGHIIPRKDRPRRSSALMKYDPYTLLVVLDSSNTAQGTIYNDDGETFDYQQGAFIHREFKFANSVLSSEDISNYSGNNKVKDAFLRKMQQVRVEKIIVVGAPESWKSKTHVPIAPSSRSEKESHADFKWFEGDAGKAAYAVVKNPPVSIADAWKINFS